MIPIIRITSFIQLGSHTNEDINCKRRSCFSERIDTDDQTGNFVAPALWSAAEVAIAIFSCSIPSVAYFLRRNVGSASSNSAEQRQNSSKKFRPRIGRSIDHTKGHERTDSLEGLQTQDSNPGNSDIAPPAAKVFVKRNAIGQGTLTAAPSYPLHSISVTRDFDVEYDRPTLRQGETTELGGKNDSASGQARA